MKKFHLLTTSLFTFATSVAQINLASFDFNASSSLPVTASTNTTNITASINGTQPNAAFAGTATGSGGFDRQN